ncbi:hypothetical protein CRYUN_Cryun38cG0031800 [Craigia yunnanensis]
MRHIAKILSTRMMQDEFSGQKTITHFVSAKCWKHNWRDNLRRGDQGICGLKTCTLQIFCFINYPTMSEFHERSLQDTRRLYKRLTSQPFNLALRPQSQSRKSQLFLNFQTFSTSLRQAKFFQLGYARWSIFGLTPTMLGMGMTLTLDDLRGALAMPKELIAGFVLQYSKTIDDLLQVMPLSGFLLSKLLNLPSHYAAGLILVGCCPGGKLIDTLCICALYFSILVSLLTLLHFLIAARRSDDLAIFQRKCSTFSVDDSNKHSVSCGWIRSTICWSTFLKLFLDIMSINIFLFPFKLQIMIPFLTAKLAGQYVAVDAAGLLISTLQVVLLPVLGGAFLNQYFQGLVKFVSPLMPPIAVGTVAILCGNAIAQNASAILASGQQVVLASSLLHASGFFFGYILSRVLKLDVASS